MVALGVAGSLLAPPPGPTNATATTSPPSRTPRAVTPSSSPTVSAARAPTTKPTLPTSKVIANTGGDGVALRSACDDSSRLPGAALADGMAVSVTDVGTGQCTGWSRVTVGQTVAWVRDIYLAYPPTATPTAVRTPTSTPTAARTTTPTPTVVPAPQPPPQPKANCSPAYPTICIPPPPPDLDCRDIGARRFKVLPPDPHRFDGDHDGIGCE